MAQPVWVLSVDLQTRTATFQTGMAEAARSARSAFGEIGAGAGEMAGAVGKHSVDVRHSLGLVDNVLRGDHMRAFVDLIRIYSQSAIVMGALPFAAVAGGLALIGGVAYEAFEHFHKLQMEQEQLNDSLLKLGTTGNNALRELDDQILKAEEKTAELKNDHVDALRIALELIDHQSMDELVKSLGTVQKAADDAFKKLQNTWYELGADSTGASHALDEFKTKYENLVSLGKSKDASDLLHGTLESAKAILAAQQTIANNRSGGTGLLGPNDSDPEATYAAQVKLREMGAGYSKKEMESQQALVTALEQQLGIETRVNELRKQDKGNANLEAGNEAAARRSAAAKESAQAQLAMGESAIAGEKASADAQLEIHNASIEARLASDLDFANREYQLKLAANQAEIAALDKSGKDYQNQLKAANDKALELQQQYDTQVTDLKARASVEINQRELTNLEQGIRQQIEATQQGTAERLAAIDAGIREEQARGLQLTSFYRDLMTQRTEAIRQAAEKQARDTENAAKEQLDDDTKMGELRIAAEKQMMALQDSSRRVTQQQRIAEDTRIANEEYNLKMAALEKERALLEKSGKDESDKLKALQDKEKQLTQQHENELTAIMEKAEQERNQRILAARTQFDDAIARGLTQSIMGHETWSRMLLSLGDQVVSGAIENAIKSMMADDMTKERDAAAAARKMWLAGASLPFPANIVAAPVMAASAFASVMAFEGGTDLVPGVGRGDVVPAMLSPGEGVVPGGVMDGLRQVARNGGFDGGPHIHVHGVQFAPQIHAIDATGVDKMLEKHQHTFQRHFESTLRRMNK